jgi:pimeloyl-ACP methyl ester carboxylesterase
LSDVVLVHGLWYRSWSLVRLKSQLAAAGHRVHSFSYPTRAQTPEQSASGLADFCLRRCCGTTHLVGHSLGGLVIMAMLQKQPLPGPGRVVFLGTPLKGSCVAQRLGRFKTGKLLLGQASALLSEGLPLDQDSPECGMISGTLARGLGRMTGALDEPNDGTVAVSETVSGQLADRLELAVSHTGLLFSKEAARQAAFFLAQGHFEHRGRSAGATP